MKLTFPTSPFFKTTTTTTIKNKTKLNSNTKSLENYIQRTMVISISIQKSSMKWTKKNKEKQNKNKIGTRTTDYPLSPLYCDKLFLIDI